MSIQIAHFNIEGKWLTWMLRHLWVEGNEVKAVKLWCDTFPEHSNEESLNEYFIPIVSGKKKFTGMASPDGFGIDEDNKKFWDPDQSGKENKSFPLLDGWHDVILFKKVKLYISELELRTFRLNRIYPSTFEGNSVKWLGSVEENKTENKIRKTVSEYWTDIRNISLQFSKNISLEMLPVNDEPLFTGPTCKNKKDFRVAKQQNDVYQKVISYLHPIQQYFTKKYGDKIFVYSSRELKQICGINEDFLKSAEWAEEDTGFFQNIKIGGIAGLPNIDVESFVNGLMKETHRDTIEPEDISKTEWRSGYIDPQGSFYGCSDLNHINFSEELCIKLKIGKKNQDGQICLDKAGWIKISMDRFFWDEEYCKKTERQKIAMHDYMNGKKMLRTCFNSTCEEKTFKEVFDD